MDKCLGKDPGGKEIIALMYSANNSSCTGDDGPYSVGCPVFEPPVASSFSFRFALSSSSFTSKAVLGARKRMSPYSMRLFLSVNVIASLRIALSL